VQAHARSHKHQPPSHARPRQHHHRHQPHGQRCLTARRLSLPHRLQRAVVRVGYTRKRSNPLSCSMRKPGRRGERRATLGDNGEEIDGRGSRDGNESESGSSGGLVSKRNVRRPSLHSACCPAGGGTGVEAKKAWSAWRRGARSMEADIHVVRVTKVGMGSARPCWRCVEWCRWAGVKHIFHWNGEDGKFDVVKVNTAERDQYGTHADIRLFAGMVRPRPIIFPPRFRVFLMLPGFMSGLVAPAQYGREALLERTL